MTDEAESVEFVGGVSAACHDDYLFYSYRHEEWTIIDTLEELGYPVDRKLKTFRLFWGDEA